MLSSIGDTMMPGTSARTLITFISFTAAVAAALAGSAGAARAQERFGVLHAFPSPGATRPIAPLVLAKDGNFYGSTYAGGAADRGTLFRITPAGSLTVLTVLHSFMGGSDGANPFGALIQATDGNLYGTTLVGGSAGIGTAFKMTSAGTVTILHEFTGGADGAYPFGALARASDGAFYGTTGYGGASGQGTVYRLTPDGSLTILHAFSGSADGATPLAGLIQATDGNFYGTTFSGGSANAGTIFRMTPAGALTVTVAFTNANGANPRAALIQAADGNLYGTTSLGGASGGGVAFRSTRDGALTVLHEFTGSVDGSHPSAPLLEAPDGNFYGTANRGGAYLFAGVVYQMTPAGVVTPVHGFNGTDGAYPFGAVVKGADGSFYGTTFNGGEMNAGTIFELTSGGIYRVLKSFDGGSEGAQPHASAIRAADGNLYGTTLFGGASNLGSVFKRTPAGEVTLLHSFADRGDGNSPATSLVQASDGNFYGTVTGGNLIFKITPAGAFSVPHILNAATEGFIPSALIQAADGRLYGTTQYGGASGVGTVFTMTPSGTFTTLHTFTGGVDGAGSVASLVQATDGNFYGTTAGGGAWNQGTLFMMTPAGVVTILHAFAGGPDGSVPIAAVIQASDGNLYGTTRAGGASGHGTVFRTNLAGGTFTTVHAFDYVSGSGPYSALVEAPDGTFFGTTAFGGDPGYGTIFKMTPGGSVTVLHAFTGADGAYPYGGLTRTAGTYYGTAQNGGPSGMGVLFRLTTARLAGDFDGDGKADLVFRNKSTGQIIGWLMEGASVGSSGFLPTIADANWEIKGRGDFDGDGKGDVLWRNKANGQNIAWLMNGNSVAGAAPLPTIADTNWEIKGVGDFDGDGKADVLWRNKATGQYIAWLMNGLSVSASAFLPTIADVNWDVKGIGDFDADGKADVILRNASTGQNIVWLMNGSSVALAAFMPTIADTNWQIAGVGDLDADRRPDIVWRNKVTGQNIGWLMNGAAVSTSAFLPTIADTNWEIKFTGDLDADGHADLVWRNKATGQNIAWLMNGLAVASTAFLPTIADTNWEIVGP